MHVHVCMYQLWQTKTSLLSDVLTRRILHEWQRSNNSIVLFLIFVYHNTKFNKHTRLMTKWEVKMAWSMNYRHTQNNWLSSIQPYASNIFTHTIGLNVSCDWIFPWRTGNIWVIFPNLQNPTCPFGMKIYLHIVLWHYLFLKAHSGWIMSTNKYWCIFSCQIGLWFICPVCLAEFWEKNRQQAVLQGSPILTLRQPITSQDLVIVPPGRATLHMFT